LDIRVFYHDYEMDRKAVVDFLFDHLDEYGDEPDQIEKAIDYALDPAEGKGGFILTGEQEGKLVGVVVINDTAMEGYIPSHILVYIAVHRDFRGQGIGRRLIQKTVELCSGNIALHVEYDNPARILYQRLGFKSKYAEMRYQQLEEKERIREMAKRIQKRLKTKKEGTLQSMQQFEDCCNESDEDIQTRVEEDLYGLVESMTDWDSVLTEKSGPLSVVCDSFKNLIGLRYNEQVLLNRFKSELVQAVERLMESADWEYVWDEYHMLRKAVRRTLKKEEQG